LAPVALVQLERQHKEVQQVQIPNLLPLLHQSVVAVVVLMMHLKLV
jgi:hypothetical protein